MKRVSRGRTVQRSGGYTLIELMLVVSIMGMLGALAIPSFNTILLRARRSERDVHLTVIGRSLMQLVDGSTRLKDAWGAGTEVYAWYWNPNVPASKQKAAYTATFPSSLATENWRLMGWQPDGNLYYRYFFWAYMPTNGAPWVQVQAQSDLDGDGVVATRTLQWTRYGNSWVVTTDSRPEDSNPPVW